MIGFGKNTKITSAKYVPYLYDRIKSIVLSFNNTSILSADKDNVVIPTDFEGNEEVFTNSDVTFRVFYGGISQTSNWTITVLSSTNVTTSQVDNTISITAISDDEGEYVVRAVRPDYTTITKTIKVYKIRHGSGWTSGSYDSDTGIVTFTSDDGLGFVTNDIRGGPQGIQGIQGEPGEDGIDGSDGGVIQNVNLSLQPKDDGTITGNARGSNAVDLQSDRANADEVATGSNSVISGGEDNKATAASSTISGGFANIASGIFSTIGGGHDNVSSNSSSTVGGGADNTNSGSGSTISGGSVNETTTDGCSIGGGFENTASAIRVTIPGGRNNDVSGDYSSALGSYNTISGTWSGVLGSENSITDAISIGIGIGGVSDNNGEIILSNSNSPVKQVFINLENNLNGLTSVNLDVAGRSTGTIGSHSTSVITMLNNTLISGTISFVAASSLSIGEVTKLKYSLIAVCVSNTVTVKHFQQLPSEHQYITGAITITPSLSVGVANSITVQVVTASATELGKCSAVLEGIKMDL